MAAQLEITSEEGKGSTFTCHFPPRGSSCVHVRRPELPSFVDPADCAVQYGCHLCCNLPVTYAGVKSRQGKASGCSRAAQAGAAETDRQTTERGSIVRIDRACDGCRRRADAQCRGRVRADQRHGHQGRCPVHPVADAGAGRAPQPLETTNAELKTQNSELQALADRREAEMEYLKAQTKELREEGAVAVERDLQGEGRRLGDQDQGPRRPPLPQREHLARSAPSAGEAVDAADRDRQRIRARLGFDFKATDNVKGTLLFATGGDDPRSSNQTLGGTGTRKTIGLDMAYVDWKFMHGGNRCSASRSTRSSSPARACSTTATSTRKAAPSSSTAACSSARPTAGGSASSTTPTRTARTPTPTSAACRPA